MNTKILKDIKAFELADQLEFSTINYFFMYICFYFFI